MQKFEQRVGSAHNLVVFEAAARHASFSKAASELSVTQPAVSQAVRRLESAIGVALFRRLHRAIQLTDAGEKLYAEVSEAFRRISFTAFQLGRAAGEDHVTILASTAFANWWLVPRLSEFHRLHPTIDLRIVTVDKDIEIDVPTNTLAVRRGEGLWAGHTSHLISPEILSACASPGLFAANAQPRSLQALARMPLIHLDEPHRIRPGWQDFFSANGFKWRDTGAGLRLNDYSLVVQAAMAGEGVAMAWHHICDRLIESGLLQRAGTWSWTTGAGFYLVVDEAARLTPKAVLTMDWILQAARQDRENRQSAISSQTG